MTQIVSGARHYVEYVTCLAVSRETSVLEGTAVTLSSTSASRMYQPGKFRFSIEHYYTRVNQRIVKQYPSDSSSLFLLLKINIV